MNRDNFSGAPTRELLRRHIEAVWYLNAPELSGDDVELTAEQPPPPEDESAYRPFWAAYQARLVEGDAVRLWRAGLAPVERAELARLLEQALDHPEESVAHVVREVALRLAAEPAMPFTEAARVARRLSPTDHPDTLRYLQQTGYEIGGRQEPIVGVMVEGRLVSIAHSSRRTAYACELGIDTLPEARRHGYALAATVVWTRAILEEGLIPFYSALAENRASLALAHAAGYREFGRAAYITR